MSIIIEKAGLFSSFQDFGRHGYQMNISQRLRRLTAGILLLVIYSKCCIW